MSVTIFVEGGGDSQNTIRKCRAGFADYISRVTKLRCKPNVFACGGRGDAFKDFKTALENAQRDDICVLLVDSEGPIQGADPVEHLRLRDHWEFPADLNGHRVFLMVQATEAWFLADREALAKFYGNGFRQKALRGSADNVEQIPKDDLVPSLNGAAKDTSKKGYHKTRDGFSLLFLIDPKKVGRASPHAEQFHQFLREL